MCSSDLVTQSQFISKYPNKYQPEPYWNTKPLLFNCENSTKRPLTLNFPDGDFLYRKTSEKIINKPQMNLKGDSRNKFKGLKLVTSGQMNEGKFIISTTTGREQRVFPSEMNLGLISGNKTANPWPKLSRNITSSESGRMSNPYSRSILPKIEIKNSYTETPYTYAKMNPARLEHFATDQLAWPELTVV